MPAGRSSAGVVRPFAVGAGSRPVAGGESPDIGAVSDVFTRIFDAVATVGQRGSPGIFEIIETRFGAHEGVLDPCEIDPHVRILVPEQRREVHHLVVLETAVIVGSRPAVPYAARRVFCRSRASRLRGCRGSWLRCNPARCTVGSRIRESSRDSSVRPRSSPISSPLRGTVRRPTAGFRFLRHCPGRNRSGRTGYRPSAVRCRSSRVRSVLPGDWCSGSENDRRIPCIRPKIPGRCLSAHR